MGNLAEFEHYLERLCEVLGNVDRSVGLKDYCRGLMLPIARKSIEPLAACSDPLHVAAKHQSLHHFVAKSAWSDTGGRAGDEGLLLDGPFPTEVFRFIRTAPVLSPLQGGCST
ncbi:MAG: transposase [Nitrosomonadales bacterium]|nr:transposase [Nitrosomonadales bacterium]